MASDSGAVTVEALDVIAALGDAVICTTVDGRITAFNPAAERLFGYRADEVMGRHVAMLAPQPDLADLTKVVTRVCAGELVQVDGTARRSDGSTVEVAV